MSTQPEPSDNHVYNMVTFRGNTLRFLVKSIEFYRDLLSHDLEVLRADNDLAVLFPESEESSNRARYEIQQATDMIEWLSRNIEDRGRSVFGCELNVSHGAVRYMKTTALLYLQRLRQRREIIASAPNVSRFVLSEIDQKIARYEELTETGVFARASHADLLVSAAPEPVGAPSAAVAQAPLSSFIKPAPVVHDSIEILDPQLKDRCMDLFRRFSEGGEHHRLDMILSEATRILENRIRTKSGAPDGAAVAKLVPFAFKADAPRLRVSDTPDKQTAMLNWLSGVFGFVRNEVHHNVVEDLQPTRVLQIVGMIDYLLWIVDAAEKTSDASV